MLLSFNPEFVLPILRGEKTTTVRDDLHNRWRPGMKIHACTGSRSKAMNTFATGVATDVQCVEITDMGVFVNYKEVDKDEFAYRDGFGDDADAFNRLCAWFLPSATAIPNRCYVGKVITMLDITPTDTWLKSVEAHYKQSLQVMGDYICTMGDTVLEVVPDMCSQYDIVLGGKKVEGVKSILYP